MDLNIKLTDKSLLPTRAFPTDAGLDLRLAEELYLAPGEQKTVSTGVSVAIPIGYVGQVYMRSGLARKHGLSLVNGVGVIDSSYRGVIGATIKNNGAENFRAVKGDRVVQLVIVPVEIPDLCVVDDLGDTDRGEGGFGSSGVK